MCLGPSAFWCSVHWLSPVCKCLSCTGESEIKIANKTLTKGISHERITKSQLELGEPVSKLSSVLYQDMPILALRSKQVKMNQSGVQTSKKHQPYPWIGSWNWGSNIKFNIKWMQSTSIHWSCFSNPITSISPSPSGDTTHTKCFIIFILPSLTAANSSQMRAEPFPVTNLLKRLEGAWGCRDGFCKAKADFEEACSEEVVLTFLTNTISNFISSLHASSKVTVICYTFRIIELVGKDL